MDSLWQVLNPSGPWRPGSHTLETILLSLLLAFVLGQVVAWMYVWTHDGISYSRSFPQSVVMITVIVALVMIVVDNNIITAFGLIGALAIVRFRNVLKDTRDTAFIFSGLVIGMGVGSQKYVPSVIGTIVLVVIMYYLYWTSFGARGHYDGILRCRLATEPAPSSPFGQVLRRYCLRTRQISYSQLQQEALSNYTFQLRLRDIRRSSQLVSELENLQGVQDVSLVLQEELVGV